VSAHRPTPRVRPAAQEDLARTARLHEEGLPEGFFARIGWRFLRAYHAAFSRSPEATVLVADGDDGTPQGVLVGTLDNAAHYRWAMRRQGARLAVLGLVGLLAKPRLAAEFVRTRVGRYARAVGRQLRPGRSGPPDAGRGRDASDPVEPRSVRPAADRAAATREGPADGRGPTADREPVDDPRQWSPPKVAVLTHVTVAEDARGAGVGGRLVQGFVERARRAGAREVRLITEADGAAARFYWSLGWTRRARRRASDGSEVEEYVREL
jgi:ribosomal protein S18 acetylase RimI-like enzyme